MKKSRSICATVLLAILLSGCVEREVSLRELRADIPEFIIDSDGTYTRAYIMGIEKYRYQRLELYVNGKKVAEDGQALVLNHFLEFTGAIEVEAMAVTESTTYVHVCSMIREENGIRIRNKSERLIEWKNMPYEIIMEAEK